MYMMINMAVLQLGSIILYSFYAIGYTRTESIIPPFTKPEICDPALGKWFYINNTKQTNIELQEEVSRQILIAEINYAVEGEPEIGTFRSPNNNYLLGAEIKKNGTNKWGIYITKKQDYETKIMRQYKFEILIGSTNFAITLNILNIDDNAPIIQPDERNCAVEENYAGHTNCSYTIHDADGWIDQINVMFKSMPKDGSHNFKFQLKPVSGVDRDYSVIAHLDVIQYLDFENITMYMLTMTATDGAGNSSSVVTPVEVTDMPDEAPKWTRLAASEILEEKSMKTLAVSAIDGDVRINAEINYKIIPEEGEETLFTIEPTTGSITIHEIDRDMLKKEVFRFQIIAYEKDNISSVIEATVIVIVVDRNDHIPEISPDELSIDIQEETYMSLDFSQPITISDVDLAENAQYYVSLDDDSDYHWSSAFAIVPNRGYQTNNFTISVVNASLLDYEDEHWRYIMIKLQSIEVANKSHINERIIEINLRNWNDELPVFETDTVEVSIPENVEMGFYIATIFAKDRDINDIVTHSLVAQKVLEVNESTGVIVTSHNNALDFEMIPIIVVQIVATDLAKHKTYATLVINVIDVNDVPPALDIPRMIPPLIEEVGIGTVIAEIEATDIDSAAQLIFSIDWDMTTARKTGVIVNETLYREHLTVGTKYPTNDTRFAKGIFSVTGRIDYEAFDVIYINVVVTDVTTVHNDNSSSASITLNIVDKNDNTPVFDIYEPMSVSENQLANTLIGAITATDADGPFYNEISYYIEPINNTVNNLVQINNNTGVIRVDANRAIDAEIYEYIYYNVTATDSENNRTISIAIYVIDMNDEVPYLLNDKYHATIHIPEKSQNGTEIVKLFGKDNDRTDPYHNVSYLINTNYSALFQYFNLGRYDGLLQVNLVDGYILDRDFVDANYTLNLKLRDNYLDDGITWNTNTLDVVVTVILDDINDQIPRLPNRSDPITEISEITNGSVLVVTITAEDHDDPNTNNTKVDYKLLDVTLTFDEAAHELRERCNNLFEVKTVDAKYAQVYTTRGLRGCYGTWAIKLYAQDRGMNPGPLNDTKTYNIRITDYNYYAPVIVFPIQGKNIALSRDQLLHTQLKTYDMQALMDFKATDNDYGASGQVRLSLSKENSDGQYFEVMSTHANSAMLQLQGWPNFDRQERFKLVITATDGGIPSKNVSQDVTIIFVSSPDPEFNATQWEIWVKENVTSLAFSILIPVARDDINENGGNVDIYYFIDKKVGDYEFFELNNFTRNLTVVKELDREKQELMQIVVIATADRYGPPREPKKKATLNITISVLDENDNPPFFEMDLYSAGVAIEDKVNNIIMKVKASDADLNDTLTYSITVGSMVTSDSTLARIPNPFNLISDTGELSLQFSVTSDMKGFFSFQIVVYDAVNHSDNADVQVYIVSQANRVAFTLENSPAYVKMEQMFVVKSFSDTFGYICNVDDIKSSMSSNNHVLDNTTTLMSHFVDLENHSPIASEVIILASSDLQTVTSLKARLQTRSLYLIDVPTGSASVTENIQQIIQWVLICLTIFFSASCVALIVAYYIRSKSLLKRLDKMVLENEFEPHQTGLGHVSVAPTTNQFVIAGSNPIWCATKKSEGNSDDNSSQTSGDSDLIGIENNTNFDDNNGDINREEGKDWNERDAEQNDVVKITFHDPYFQEIKYSESEDTC